MRLPSIPPNQVTAEQRSLFDKLNTGIREHLHGFTTHKPDGSLIGPFSALLLFPAYGTPVWDLFLALGSSSVLPKAAREVVILATAARFGSLYEGKHQDLGGVMQRRPERRRRRRCRWRDPGTIVRTIAGACRRERVSGSAGADGRRAWSTASAGAWRSAC
jgi:hypothetical protein